MEHVYKVCNVKTMANEQKAYYSFGGVAMWDIRYELGKPSKAKKGMLFCFQSLHNARHFLYQYYPSKTDNMNDYRLALLLCETEKVILPTEKARELFTGYGPLWEGYWDALARGNVSSQYVQACNAINTHIQFVPGTVFCKEITPLQVLEV